MSHGNGRPDTGIAAGGHAEIPRHDVVLVGAGEQLDLIGRRSGDAGGGQKSPQGAMPWFYDFQNEFREKLPNKETDDVGKLPDLCPEAWPGLSQPSSMAQTSSFQW